MDMKTNTTNSRRHSGIIVSLSLPGRKKSSSQLWTQEKECLMREGRSEYHHLMAIYKEPEM
jgi:hypothetical protein